MVRQVRTTARSRRKTAASTASVMALQRRMPSWQRWISANCAYESASSNAIGCETLVQPRPDLGERVFKSIHHVDPNAMFRLRHGVEDRLTAPFGHSLDHQAPTPPVTSDSKSIGAKIGGCIFSNVD